MTTPMATRLCRHVQAHRRLLAPGVPLPVQGRLVRVSGLVMEATGLRLPLGAVCRVFDGAASTEAEVVGFSRGRLHLMPTEYAFQLSIPFFNKFWSTLPSYFHFWDRACIKIFGKSVDRCRQELIAVCGLQS